MRKEPKTIRQQITDIEIKKATRIPHFFMTLICTTVSLSTVDAAQFTVSNTMDDGCGTLRAAMFCAQSGDEITFNPNLSGVISLQSVLPWINGDLIIQGPTSGTVVIDGMDE